MRNNDPRVKTINPKIGGPIAIVLILGFAGIFIYGYIKESKDNKAFIADPKVHDVYYTKDDLARYSVMRLVDIKGDEILVEKGNFSVSDKKQLRNKEWTFSPAVWLKKSELDRMYAADEITSVVRPAGE